MKKIILFFLLLSGITLSAQTDSEWQPWQKTSCYSNIEFRVKYVEKNGSRNHWAVEFKNNYNELISFNYHVTDKLQQYNLTTHRKMLKALEVSTATDVYTDFDDLFLIVDKVSLSPYPEDFLECDQ